MSNNESSSRRMERTELQNQSWLSAKLGGWNDFWFRSVDPIGLGFIRLLIGCVALFWLLTFHGHVDEFFAKKGWVSAETLEKLATEDEGVEVVQGPWSPAKWITTTGALHSVYWATIIVTGLFAAGVLPRWTGIAAWLGIATFSSNPYITIEGDVLLWFGLSYVVAAYVFMGWSQPDSRPAFLLGDGRSLIAAPIGGRNLTKPELGSVSANFWIRVFQIHFAFFLAFAVIQKLRVAEWWAGDALWFPMHPAYSTTFESITEEKVARSVTLTRSLYSLAAYAVIFWQLSFPFLIWRASWRKFYQWTSFIGAVFTWSVYHDPAYAFMLVVGTLAFSPVETWQRLASRYLGREQIQTSFPESTDSAKRRVAAEDRAPMTAGRAS